jgi:hypothetical protein
MINLLAQYLGTGKFIRVTRRQPSEPKLNGYLLGLSSELALMHTFDAFEPDGYTLFRIEDVLGVRCGPHQQWFDHMLLSEGLLAGLNMSHRIELSNMRSAILSIAAHYDQMIIACEDPDEDIEDFYIGVVLKVGVRFLQFRYYDTLGYWEEEASSIALDEITKVQFDAPYIRIFSKYTREGTPSDVSQDDEDDEDDD